MADLMTGKYRFDTLSKQYDNFFVPVYKIEVAGTDMTKLLQTKLVSLSVALSIDKACSASFTLFDVFDLKARTIDSTIDQAMKPGNVVSVRLGYGSRVVKVFHGYIAEVTMEFRDAPSMHVVAVDVVSLMMKNRLSNYAYSAKNYSDIVTEIVGKYGKYIASKRIDSTKDDLQTELQTDTDYNYIKNVICQLTNKQFIVMAGVVYFRDYDKEKTPIMDLEWGTSLLSFVYRRKYLNETYVVTGQAENKKEKVTAQEEAKARDLSMSSVNVQIQMADSGVTDHAKAKAKAKNYKEKAETGSRAGSGSVIGLPQIVPGRYINITNVGSASGKYYISSVKHQFSESGFVTEFELGD